jgi:multiple sugar transport system ATP-binding protein
MNFFDGAVMMVDGEMAFEERTSSSEAGFRVPVPAHLTGRLAGYVGRQVVLGIRPEHMDVRPIAGGASAPLSLRVNVVEPLGNDMDIYMSSKLNDHIVARVEAAAAEGVAGLRTDGQATMFVDLRKVHFFEPGDTGMNLSQTSEPAHAVA